MSFHLFHDWKEIGPRVLEHALGFGAWTRHGGEIDGSYSQSFYRWSVLEQCRKCRPGETTRVGHYRISDEEWREAQRRAYGDRP